MKYLFGIIILVSALILAGCGPEMEPLPRDIYDEPQEPAPPEIPEIEEDEPGEEIAIVDEEDDIDLGEMI